MWKKIVVIGGTVALIGGAGTAAFASSATATPSPSSIATTPGSSAQTVKPGADKRANKLGRAVHATWVTQNRKTRAFITHDAIRGQVSAVSPTSITVRAADSTTETYLITSKTKVFTRLARAQAPKTVPARTPASISDVKTGDSVLVGGTGTSALTALRVVDIHT